MNSVFSKIDRQCKDFTLSKKPVSSWVLRLYSVTSFIVVFITYFFSLLISVIFFDFLLLQFKMIRNNILSDYSSFNLFLIRLFTIMVLLVIISGILYIYHDFVLSGYRIGIPIVGFFLAVFVGIVAVAASERSQTVRSVVLNNTQNISMPILNDDQLIESTSEELKNDRKFYGQVTKKGEGYIVIDYRGKSQEFFLNSENEDVISEGDEIIIHYEESEQKPMIINFSTL